MKYVTAKIPDIDKRLDDTTKQNLDRVRKFRLSKRYDFVILVVGKVGRGKSTLAQLICAYIDVTFNNQRIFFSSDDYRFYERKLKPMMSYMFDEAADVFFSRSTMERAQKKMVLTFAKIRQKRNFIVLCTPSLTLLEKWFRGMGTESRIDAIFRVTRRGMFAVYTDKTGTINRIKIDSSTKSVKYPQADYIGFFQPIPIGSDWWKGYTHAKNNYLKQADENPKARRLMLRQRLRMQNTLTLREISEIHKVHLSTVQRWYKDGWFGTRGCFIGLDGKVRIKMVAYRAGVRRLEKYKQSGRLPQIVKKRLDAIEHKAKRAKRKKKRKRKKKKRA